jgi:hypothetical protein
LSVVEKRRVTMRNVMAVPGGIKTHEAVDYVPVDEVALYVQDAQTRWQSVEVGDDHDPGPDGDTITEPLEG